MLAEVNPFLRSLFMRAYHRTLSFSLRRVQRRCCGAVALRLESEQLNGECRCSSSDFFFEPRSSFSRSKGPFLCFALWGQSLHERALRFSCPSSRLDVPSGLYGLEFSRLWNGVPSPPRESNGDWARDSPLGQLLATRSRESVEGKRRVKGTALGIQILV